MAKVDAPFLSMIFYDREGFRRKWTDEQILGFMRAFPGTKAITYLNNGIYSIRLKGFTQGLKFEMREPLFTQSLRGKDFPCLKINFNGEYFNILENMNPPKHTPTQGITFSQLFLYLAQQFDCDYGGITMEGWLSTPLELSNGSSSNVPNLFINTTNLEKSDYEQLALMPGVTSELLGNILYLSTYNLYFPRPVNINYDYSPEIEHFTTQLERLIRRNYRPILVP